MFSTGTECFSESSARAARAACSRVAAAGSRSAHRLTGGGPSPGLLCRGSSASGTARPRVSAAEPGADQLAVGAAAEDRQLEQPGLVGGVGVDRGDHRRVGQHPAGGDVAAAGHVVAGLPERAEHAQLPAAAQPVHAGRAAPRVGLRRPAVRRPGSPRTPGGPTRSCPAPRGSRRARRGGRRAPRRPGPRRPATPRAAAGCSSRRPSGPSAARSRAATRPRRPGPRGAARPGARRARCRRSASGPGRSRPGRGGPGWRRAAPTPRRRSRPGSPTGRAAARGRSARFPTRCAAAAPGRRAARSGSPRRARRRRRPARCPRGAPRRTRPAGSRSRPPAAVRRGGRGAASRAGRCPPARRLRGGRAGGLVHGGVRLGSGLGAQLPSTFLPVASVGPPGPVRSARACRTGTGKRELRLSGRTPGWR